MNKNQFSTSLLLILIMGLSNAYGVNTCDGLIANLSGNCTKSDGVVRCPATNYNSNDSTNSTIQINFDNGWGYTIPNPQTMNFINSDKQCVLTCEGGNASWAPLTNNRMQCIITGSA